MPVYVVRHACAGEKRLWSGPDVGRPLDAGGVQQAEALADDLATTPVRRILTSPARRCRQTVEPLARRLGLAVEDAPELLPANDGERLRRLVASLGASAAVMCTHGELMAPFLAELRAAGTRITAGRHDDDWLLAKAAIWALSLDASGRIVGLHHRPPRPSLLCPHDVSGGGTAATTPVPGP